MARVGGTLAWKASPVVISAFLSPISLASWNEANSHGLQGADSANSSPVAAGDSAVAGFFARPVLASSQEPDLDFDRQRPSSILWGGAGLGSAVVLGGVLYGFRKGTSGNKLDPKRRAAAAAEMQAREKEAQSASELLLKRVPQTNVTTGGLVARAFLWGTVWAVGGFAAGTFAVCWALDVHSPEEFGDKMREILPGFRESLQSTLRPLFAHLVDDTAEKPASAGTVEAPTPVEDS